MTKIFYAYNKYVGIGPPYHMTHSDLKGVLDLSLTRTNNILQKYIP